MNKPNEIELTYVVAIEGKSWRYYDRRPHFAEFSNFGNLIVAERPLILFSKSFLKKPIMSLNNYWNHTKGVRLDERSNAKLIRPILLFPTKMAEKFSIIKKTNQMFYNYFIKKANVDFKHTVLCLTTYFHDWMVQPQKFHSYMLDLHDEWSMIKYNNKNIQNIIESRIHNFCKNIEFVTSVSIELQKKYNRYSNNYYFPNAVDTSHFIPDFDNETIKVDEAFIDRKSNLRFIEKSKNDPREYGSDLSILKNSKKPIVGSISGLSGNWSDFSFISIVEKILPEYVSMISSGIIHPPTKPEFKTEYEYYLSNQRMVYLNYLDYAVLPEYLSYLSAGLIMHRMDSFNIHSAPNKIWAYLAMGLPVISTNFINEYDKEVFEGMVNFANTPEEYAYYIISEIENNCLLKKQERRNLAIKYSTKNRAHKITELISGIKKNTLLDKTSITNTAQEVF